MPTWNYAVVHAHGVATTFDDAPSLRTLLDRLTDSHEAAMPQPWRVGDAPEDYLQAMYRAIVGIQLPIERLDGKFKLSQNRRPEDREGAMRGLASSTRAGDVAVAVMMGLQVAGSPPARG